ncbi:MAG: tyrosine-type recombinase/integrase [Rhodomicrobium sp.]
MKTKITKRAVDELRNKAKSEGRTLYLRDEELTGFGVLSTKVGACSYFVEYRLGGRGTTQKRMTIGKHGALTPDEARKRAKEELGKVARGADVSQEKREAREKMTGATLRDVVERYLEIHVERHLSGASKPTRYWAEKRARVLSDDMKPLLGKPIALIKREDIVAIFDKVQARSHASARVLFSDVRPIFAWALNRAAIEVNPMAGMKGPQPLDARDRVLSDAEIKAFWQAACELSWPFENVFKVLLLTGQRREEVAGMRWREVDLDAGQWTIAKERCKNGKGHSVDLSPEAVRMLDPVGDAAAPRLARNSGEADFVFSTTGRTAVSGFSKAKARIDARMQEILGDKFQPWRTHDLRRTAASGMAALGFQPHVIERVLNHVSGAQGGLVGVYQRHEYRDERHRAIIAWAAHVMGLVSADKLPSNVMRLRVA